MAVSVLRKIGVKPGMRSILVAAPPAPAATIGLAREALARRLAGSFDYIHLFATQQDALDAAFPKMKSHLREGGMLWISWPKGGALETDLNLKRIIAMGYGHGLVESKTISVDATWSAIKFTYPKAGKRYNNSYGQLGKRPLVKPKTR